MYYYQISLQLKNVMFSQLLNRTLELPLKFLMALTNEPTDPLGNTVGTPELTGEVMRDSKMNECAKKKNQPSLHMAKAVMRAEGLKKGDSAQFHKAVCYVLEGAFCKLIL